MPDQCHNVGMAGSSLGLLFTVTTFGESHGPAIGAVVDGCPPGMSLSVEDIQGDLDRRKPGTSRHVTQRQEADQSIIDEFVCKIDQISPPIHPGDYARKTKLLGRNHNLHQLERLS